MDIYNKDVEGKGFPITHLLPEIQAYIKNISEVYQVDKDMVTLAVYVATAVSCGRRVTTFDGIYVNKLTLWAIVLGISGAGKSEFLNRVLMPILMRNQQLVKEYEKALEEWNGKGKEPIAKDFRIHTITLEALVEKINQNPDGLFLYRPELSGWVSGFGKYNRDESEYASWIEIWDGKTFPIHTKTGNKKLINAQDPVLSVIGGVQPHIMKKFAKADFLGSGFLGRLLMVYPQLCYPAMPPEHMVDKGLEDYWAQFIENNYHRTEQFVFADEAMDKYHDFCYKYVREKVLEIGEDTTEPYCVCMLEFFGKIKVYAEKWAGITMLLAGKSGFIDGEVMAKSIEAMKVFEVYAEKVYRFIFGTPMDATSSKGEIIRRLQEVFGIKNQSMLASALGIGRSIISQYLHGKK